MAEMAQNRQTQQLGLQQVRFYPIFPIGFGPRPGISFGLIIFLAYGAITGRWFKSNERIRGYDVTTSTTTKYFWSSTYVESKSVQSTPNEVR